MSYSSQHIPIVQIMVQLKVEQKVFVVSSYFEIKSLDEVCLLFQIRFTRRPAPTSMTVWRNVKKYRNHGTSLNRNTSNGFGSAMID